MLIRTRCEGMLRWLSLLAVAMLVGLVGSEALPEGAPQDSRQAGSYLLGRQLAATQPLLAEADGLWLAAGLIDALRQRASRVAAADSEQVNEAFRRLVATDAAEQAAANATAGAAFLQEQRQRPAVASTASGLAYEVLSAAEAAPIGEAARVRARYRGSLIDGREFDSSFRHGALPMELRLAELLPGLQEGLRLMPPGSSFRFFISPELAFGESGPAGIGPQQTVIFDVELLDIVER